MWHNQITGNDYFKNQLFTMWPDNLLLPKKKRYVLYYLFFGLNNIRRYLKK